MTKGEIGDSGILQRVAARQSTEITFFLDGVAMRAREGDSLLCAIVTQRDSLRLHEFDGKQRAGFCGMGVCQDCWVWVEGHHRIRACTTRLSDGLRLTTKAPAFPGMHPAGTQEARS